MIESTEVKFEGASITINNGRAFSIGVDGYTFDTTDGEPTLGALAALLKIPDEQYAALCVSGALGSDARPDEQFLVRIAFSIACDVWKKWRAQCAHVRVPCPRCGWTG